MPRYTIRGESYAATFDADDERAAMRTKSAVDAPLRSTLLDEAGELVAVKDRVVAWVPAASSRSEGAGSTRPTTPDLDARNSNPPTHAA